MKRETVWVWLAGLLTAAACAGQQAGREIPVAGSAPSVAGTSQVAATQGHWTRQALSGARPMPIPKAEGAPGALAMPLRMERARTGDGILPRVQPGGPSMHPQGGWSEDAEPYVLNRNEDEEAESAPAISSNGTGFSYMMPFTNFGVTVADQAVYPYTTVGKLFLTVPSGATPPTGDYTCTAAVAIDKHTLVTARHCVYDPVTKIWYQNLAFYPGWTSAGKNVTLGGVWYPLTVMTWTTCTSGKNCQMLTIAGGTTLR